MDGKHMDKKYMETAVTLARLYGIAETLQPWGCLENGEFVRRIEGWTEEFLRAGGGDVLEFFESSIAGWEGRSAAPPAPPA